MAQTLREAVARQRPRGGRPRRVQPRLHPLPGRPLPRRRALVRGGRAALRAGGHVRHADPRARAERRRRLLHGRPRRRGRVARAPPRDARRPRAALEPGALRRPRGGLGGTRAERRGGRRAAARATPPRWPPRCPATPRSSSTRRCGRAPRRRDRGRAGGARGALRRAAGRGVRRARRRRSPRATAKRSSRRPRSSPRSARSATGWRPPCRPRRRSCAPGARTRRGGRRHARRSCTCPSRARAFPAIDGLDATAIGLTRREAQVAALAGRGLSNAEIADQLVLSVRTVETHVYRAMQKRGVGDRREL